jgi:hypothetical protein
MLSNVLFDRTCKDRQVGSLIEGVKKCSMFNVQFSIVIGGGASRYLILKKMLRRRRIRKMTTDN